jgi:long-chain fatty acid transport protein
MKDAFKKVVLISALTVTTSAYATNGYFLPGFGVKSQGAGGVGIALQADALSQAANPANATETGMRVDLGLSLFNPERTSATGAATGLEQPSPFLFFNQESDSGNRLYLMPDMAFTMPINDRLSVGFAMVGNGGMNTTYKENIFGSNTFGPIANGMPNDLVGVDLMQIIAPITVAYKLSNQQSVGASLNLAAQRFKANGLGQFAYFGISSDSAHLTNNGYDLSYGAGVRLGWLGKFMDDRVSIGATWASRTYMSKFDKYRGLFAEQGDFDIPENYGIGLAIKPTKNFTTAFDVVKIKYSDIASIGNPGPGTTGGTGYGQADVFAAATGFGGTPKSYSLGNDQGMGFGWKDMTVYKLGFIYDVTNHLTLRAGYNYGKTPIRNDQLVFSALAPATVERHYSVGFTYQMQGELPLEISGTYMYVANNKQQGCGQAVVDCVSYQMHQNILGIGFGLKY